MKKLFILALVLFTLIPNLAYADTFTKSEFLSQGTCELKQKFVVKKGEHVKIEATNNARGGVTFVIEDMEGNVVVPNALTVESGVEEARKKEIEIDLPKGRYVLKAQGKTYRINNAFVNRDKIESSSGYFKVKLKTIRYKR